MVRKQQNGRTGSARRNLGTAQPADWAALRAMTYHPVTLRSLSALSGW